MQNIRIDTNTAYTVHIPAYKGVLVRAAGVPYLVRAEDDGTLTICATHFTGQHELHVHGTGQLADSIGVRYTPERV